MKTPMRRVARRTSLLTTFKPPPTFQPFSPSTEPPTSRSGLVRPPTGVVDTVFSLKPVVRSHSSPCRGSHDSSCCGVGRPWWEGRHGLSPSLLFTSSLSTLRCSYSTNIMKILSPKKHWLDRDSKNSNSFFHISTTKNLDMETTKKACFPHLLNPSRLAHITQQLPTPCGLVSQSLSSFPCQTHVGCPRRKHQLQTIPPNDNVTVSSQWRRIGNRWRQACALHPHAIGLLTDE